MFIQLAKSGERCLARFRGRGDASSALLGGGGQRDGESSFRVNVNAVLALQDACVLADFTRVMTPAMPGSGFGSAV